MQTELSITAFERKLKRYIVGLFSKDIQKVMKNHLLKPMRKDTQKVTQKVTQPG